MRGCDLHIHSTASDGILAPAQIVERAAEAGLDAIAITDHDTVSGVAEAMAAGTRLGVRVIPAVELSAALDERGMHIIGYFIDHTDPELGERLAHLRSVRLARAERIVESLRQADLPVTLEDVLRAAEGGAVGRAHIAQVLVDTGHAATVRDAFDRLLGSGRPHYVPKPVGSVTEVLGWIRDAGGIAVVAHPALSGIDDLVPALAEAGVTGIEAYHASHDAETRARYLDLARRHGLVATGGSDFHGPSAGNPLGSAPVPACAVDELEAAWLHAFPDGGAR